jgi:hypothetical protein
MAQTFAQFDTPILHSSGARYTAKACGRERDDGTWEGWIEFEDTDTGEALRSSRETTQPNATDLAYWATGLSEVYLEGALARALTSSDRPDDLADPPIFDGPADRLEARRRPTGHAILDPFSVYEKSADLLARELTALRSRHLKQIIKEYRLTSDPDEALDSLTEPELGALILTRMRELHA